MCIPLESAVFKSIKLVAVIRPSRAGLSFLFAGRRSLFRGKIFCVILPGAIVSFQIATFKLSPPPGKGVACPPPGERDERLAPSFPALTYASYFR